MGHREGGAWKPRHLSSLFSAIRGGWLLLLPGLSTGEVHLVAWPEDPFRLRITAHQGDGYDAVNSMDACLARRRREAREEDDEDEDEEDSEDVIVVSSAGG